MNRDKWERSMDLHRLLTHLTEVLPPRLLALVACELAEYARVQLASHEGAGRLAAALARVRGWALAAAPVPLWAEVWAADSERPWPNNDSLAAALLQVPLTPRAVEQVAQCTAMALLDPKASEFLAHELKRLVPWLEHPQVRFERAAEGHFRTEELDCAIEQQRLVRCARRSSGGAGA